MGRKPLKTLRSRRYQADCAINIIKKARLADKQRTNKILYASAAVIALLLLALILVIVTRRKRK